MRKTGIARELDTLLNVSSVLFYNIILACFANTLQT